MAFLIQKFHQLLQDIDESQRKSGRIRGNICVVAATKYCSAVEMNNALKAGIADIGENRVQDAVKKFPQLEGSCRTHFIGHLQTNKVKKAVELFDMIESVDRLELLQKLIFETDRTGKSIDVLLQVNIANDDAKFGCSVGEIEELVYVLQSAKHLVFRGFMSIIPFREDLEDTRIWFRNLRTVFEKYQAKFPLLDTLSMGMSHDFRVAIEEGATQVRVGSLLFKE